jgi:hypothetical protein
MVVVILEKMTIRKIFVGVGSYSVIKMEGAQKKISITAGGRLCRDIIRIHYLEGRFYKFRSAGK